MDRITDQKPHDVRGNIQGPGGVANNVTIDGSV